MLPPQESAGGMVPVGWDGPLPFPPSAGRIVHYVLAASDPVKASVVGEHRPALIVRTWGPDPNGAIQLQVFLDGSNDSPDGALALWATSVLPDHTGVNGRTWHWPERV